MSTKFIVLGSVLRRHTAHGYEVLKDIKSWESVDRSTGINPGSVYHALNGMEQQGLLQSQQQQVEDASDKKQRKYSITSAGYDFFIETLHIKLESTILSEFSLGLGFMQYSKREDVIQSLNVALEKNQDLRKYIQSLDIPDSINDPSLNPVLADLWTGIHQDTANFIIKLIEQLDSGKFEFSSK